MPLLVGTRKGLFTVDDDGRISDLSFAGAPVTAIVDSAHGTLIGLRHGHYGPKLHRLQGGEWSELTAPALPASEDANAPSVDTLWCLDESLGGTLWAGTIPGALFRSDDGGTHWSLVQSLWDRPERARWFGGGFDDAGVHTVLGHPSDPDRLIVGVSCGGVWLTADRGESWTQGGYGLLAKYMPPDRQRDPVTQDPHRMALCRAQPDRVWMQHHHGIFRSDDSGMNWVELDAPPTGFGFPVVAHPEQPDTAWFVPGDSDGNRVAYAGKVVVLKTEDGGDSWRLLTEGLPQEHAYDLVYRHALDLDASGRRLAFGSTTGSLWWSEDGGQRWRAISEHLPPIYAVRWVGSA